MVNLIRAIQTICRNQIEDIGDFYKSKNRINAAGDALELFVKDIFADTLNELDQNKKNLAYEQTFSYFGNQNNPPDLMLFRGDAVEVKKIESESTKIALNSSYPSAKIFANSPMITTACRGCEDWFEKDLIYAIGSIKNSRLRTLWFVYGDCYAASREVYERIRTKIETGISSISMGRFPAALQRKMQG